MAQSLHLGRENVGQSILGLPKTKHDIAGAPSAFCLDSWLTGSTLFVTVHGQFTEGRSFFPLLTLCRRRGLRTRGGLQSVYPTEPVNALRSFDRSFVLAPAADDSR